MKFSPVRLSAALTGIVGALALFNLSASRNILAQEIAYAPQGSEFVGGPWLNTPENKPLTLAARRGKVTIVEFWTFACSNCQANLPAYARWYAKFQKQGVEVVGIHTPEMDFERDPKNVARRVKELGIKYPVLIDSQNQNWGRWNQQYWPTIYLVDKAGRVRYRHIGELQGAEAQVTQRIEALLQEPAPQTAQARATGTNVTRITKTDAQWKAQLSPAAFSVLRQQGTEPPFSGDLSSHGSGTYHCAGCDLDLFDASTKFDSGTGWPSFYRAIAGHVIEKTDTSDGMTRTEVLCARCAGHLGHVFDDGPRPTGLRYCMNSVALKFEPKDAK